MRLALLLALLLWLPEPGQAAPFEPDTMTVTEFPLRADWDISRQGSRVTVDFTVSEYRIYQFMIEFKRQTGVDQAATQAYIGTGKLIRVSAESAKSEHPQVLADMTQEELDFLASGGMAVTRSILDTPEGRTRVVDFIDRAGAVEKRRTYHQPPFIWIYAPGGAGMGVPVELRLFSLQQPQTVLLNDLFNTQGTVDGGYRRQITAAALRRGRYRLEISATEDHPLPQGLQSGLVVTYNPKVLPASR